MKSPSSLFSVAGKNVLITGGSRGIGLMIATGFAQHGANVLLTSRDATACQEAASRLPNCQFVASNVSSREGCDILVRHAADLFENKLHILINNAGTSWGEPLDRDSGKANWGFDKVLDLNVKGMFYLTRACLPLLETSATKDDPARIINIGSVAGLVSQAAPTHACTFNPNVDFQTHDSVWKLSLQKTLRLTTPLIIIIADDVSKAAVHQLTKKFAADFASKHITVNCIAPGFVPSRMSQGLATWGGEAEILANSIPLQRLGNQDDMAGACIYLSSRAGSWCTGVVLPVDGGTVGAMQIPLSNL
jgi:NAD(P)-dependent dehydrogenase (short-subunit alcohol dehydrogenase family)